MSILKNEFKMNNFIFCHFGGLRNNDEHSKNYKEYIFKLANELNVNDVIVWLGHRNDIGDIMSAFDIYVHPSRMEGIGLANMEAATQSLPIVGSDIGGIPEIVIDGVNGFLFESDNAEQLAEGIYKLMKDMNLREKMGKESLMIVNKNFNIDVQTNKLVNYYFNI